MAENGSRMPFNVQTEDVDRFKHRLLRTKTIQSQSSIEKDDAGEQTTGSLQKVLTTFDLTSLGVGSCCGTGMYVVAGMVVKNVAGPSTLISFLIAAMASILSGVCYGEFGVRVPKTSGSAYMYSYVSVGEFVAFLIGWNLILEYIIGSAAGASALSACFDALGNHSMSFYLRENIGTVIGSTYPDFLGCTIGLAMTAILALGVRNSMLLNNVLNGVNLLVFAFIVIAGLKFANPDNWSPFAPQGASGVFSGAATCFYAFIGFDIIATTGEEARHAGRSIPRAIIMSLVICLASYASVTIVLTLMLPSDQVHAGSSLVDAFAQVGMPAGKYVVAVGAVAALSVSLLGSMFPMPRVIYAMSRDGLLFDFLSEIHPKTGTPLVATIITGLTASLMSLLVSLDILVEMMSIGTLLAYTLVCVSVLMLRYQPHSTDIQQPLAMTPTTLDIIEESPVHTPSGEEPVKDDRGLLSSAEEKSRYGSVPIPTRSLSEWFCKTKEQLYVLWLRFGFPSHDAVPSHTSAKAATLYIGVLIAVETTMCMLIVFGHAHLAGGDALSVICLLILLGALLFCIAMILRQPQNNKKLSFMAPGVPFLPCSAVFFNTYLMLKLPGLTWARLGVWLCIGMLLYFTYGMWHSAKERKYREKERESRHEKDLAEIAKHEMERRNEGANGVGTGVHCGSTGVTGSANKMSEFVLKQNGGAHLDYANEHVTRPSERSCGSAYDSALNTSIASSIQSPYDTVQPQEDDQYMEHLASRADRAAMFGSPDERYRSHADDTDPYVVDEYSARNLHMENDPSPSYARPRPRAKNFQGASQKGMIPGPG